jgi:hypothetical protein
MRAMDPAVEFERCIRLVAASAARTAKRTVTAEAVSPLPPAIVPQPGTPGHELAVALALGPDEVELVWSVVGRAVEPQVAAHAREVFGEVDPTIAAVGGLVEPYWFGVNVTVLGEG